MASPISSNRAAAPPQAASDLRAELREPTDVFRAFVDRILRMFGSALLEPRSRIELLGAAVSRARRAAPAREWEVLRESAERTLLAEVVRDPLADVPRLQYADFMDMISDPRGEFIRLQIATVHADPASPATRRRVLAADRLLKQHGACWAGEIADLVDSYAFSRGFVELVVMSARAFLASATRLKELAPVMHLEVSDTEGVAETLLRSDALKPIRSLSLDGCGLTDRHAEMIAENPALKNLRWLSLANNEIGPYGVHALASSEYLQDLRFVNLFGNLYDPTPRFAHEDNRVLDVWGTMDDNERPQTGRIETWMRTASPAKPFVPNRFRMALQHAAPAPTTEPAVA